MIKGIGIDVVHVDRIRHWLKIPGLVHRYFHPAEVASLAGLSEAQQALFLAARFAAKEAFGKALGIGLSGIRLADIQVINTHNGKPHINLHGTALAHFEAQGSGMINLSLTHEHDNAIAMVVIDE